MTNKEFVEELINRLNTLNRDTIRFNKDPLRQSQKFLITERVITVRKTRDLVTLSGTKYVHNLEIRVELESRKTPFIILLNRYVSDSNNKTISNESIDTLYGQIGREIIKSMLFLKEGVYTTLHGVDRTNIPINTIISEGYEKAKERIINESK